MWERGLDNPGDLLEGSNINFRRSKVFDLTAEATRRDVQSQTGGGRQQGHAEAAANVTNYNQAESPSKVHPYQGSSLAATPDGFISRLQSPKLMDESNFSSRRATPRVAAFDGAAGVTSASGTNSRIYSHMNRGTNHLPAQYDPEIDGFTTIRRQLQSGAGDAAVARTRDDGHGADDVCEHESAACSGIFARVRGLLRQERATSKYKDSHKGSMNPMKFVSRWNNFIWIAVNVVLDDARTTAASAAPSAPQRPRCMRGVVSVAGFSQAMEDTLCAHMAEWELALLAREYHSGPSGSIAYARILLALISSNNPQRDSRKLLLWQALEGASGFRGRLPLANVFRTMNVAGHPLVANRMCDASEFSRAFLSFCSRSRLVSGTMADTLLRLLLVSAAITDAHNLCSLQGGQAPTPQLLPVRSRVFSIISLRLLLFFCCWPPHAPADFIGGAEPPAARRSCKRHTCLRPQQHCGFQCNCGGRGAVSLLRVV